MTFTLFCRLRDTQTDFRGLTRMLMLLLASSASGPNEETDASASLLAEQLDCTDRAVRNCLNALVVTGVIAVVDGGGGRGNPKRIRIMWRGRGAHLPPLLPTNPEPQTLNETSNPEPQTLNGSRNPEPQTLNTSSFSESHSGFGDPGYINSSTVGRTTVTPETPVTTNSQSTVLPSLSPLPPSSPQNKRGPARKKFQRGDLRPLTDEDRQRLHERWDQVCGGVESVDSQIALSLDNEAVEKYTHQFLYVNNWLQNFATREAERLRRLVRPSTNGHVTAFSENPPRERLSSATD